MSLNAAVVDKVPASSLQVSKPTWWLESRFHFSFAEYFDPARMNYGALRVVNDDLVKAKAGFGTHPHRDAEIFSYVIEGQLSHADSMGNHEALGRGCVQYLSAGTGVLHSELNEGDKTCRFLQIWLTPDKRGHKPQYGSSTYTKEDRHNRLLHILGGNSPPPQWAGVHAPNSIHLHQDANVYVSELDAGKSLSVDLGRERAVYLVCIEGALDVNGTPLTMRDAAKVTAPSDDASAPASAPLTLTAGDKGAHLLMIEMERP